MSTIQWMAAVGEARGHPKAWRYQRRSAKVNLVIDAASSPTNSSPDQVLERTHASNQRDSDTDGQTFTMASRTGLMKQSITTAGDMGDMSPPTQVRCENDAKTSLLRHNRERNATEMDMTILRLHA